MDFQTLEKIDRLNKEIEKLHNQNQQIIKQMLLLVDATEKGFSVINEELVRITKLR